MSASPATSALLAGKYQLVAPLGEGGMGAVWRAVDTTLGRPVAIKFLQARLIDSAEMRARFEQEARVVGALVHEHIVDARDYGVDEVGRPFLVMELLQGESLGALISRTLAETGHGLVYRRGVALVAQACRGVAAAHARGVIHRDLKPENLYILRRSDGGEHVKVLDFGIAKLHGMELVPQLRTETGQAYGTPYYMAPEQIHAVRDINQQVDVYALGSILYEALSGRKAHEGGQYSAIVASIVTRDPTPIQELEPQLPHGLGGVVAKAMARERQERYSSLDELLGALHPFEGPAALSSSGLRNGVQQVGPSPIQNPYSREPMAGVLPPFVGSGKGDTVLVPAEPPGVPAVIEHARMEQPQLAVLDTSAATSDSVRIGLARPRPRYAAIAVVSLFGLLFLTGLWVLLRSGGEEAAAPATSQALAAPVSSPSAMVGRSQRSERREVSVGRSTAALSSVAVATNVGRPGAVALSASAHPTKQDKPKPAAPRPVPTLKPQPSPVKQSSKTVLQSAKYGDENPFATGP